MWGGGRCCRTDRCPIRAGLRFVHRAAGTDLTLCMAFPIVRGMIGLNQICGICREIIR